VSTKNPRDEKRRESKDVGRKTREKKPVKPLKEASTSRHPLGKGIGPRKKKGKQEGANGVDRGGLFLARGFVKDQKGWGKRGKENTGGSNPAAGDQQ